MKQLIRKILKEQDEIINVPDLDFFDGDWEQLLEFTRGRKFRVRGDLNLMDICPETLGNIISVDGYLNLWRCKNLTSLGSLERVGGSLYLFNCTNLTSLGNLEYVGRNLNLYNCENLTSLGSLERVDGHLNLYNCKNLTSLGNLKYVGQFSNLNRTPIADMYSEEEIRKMVDVKGYIYFT
jgi:hypothetical protein